VSDKIAGASREKLVATSKFELAKTVGADGKARPARKLTEEGQAAHRANVHRPTTRPTD